MTDHPQEHDIMSITHCQIDRSSDTCTPHEHESLSAFIEKVEASGEDRKHAPLGYIDDDDLEEMQHRPWIACNPRIWEERLKDTTAIYNQQQLDDAVRAERERSAADTKRLQTLVDNLEDDGYGFWLSEWCVKEGDVRPTLDELRAFLDNPNEEQEP